MKEENGSKEEEGRLSSIAINAAIAGACMGIIYFVYGKLGAILELLFIGVMIMLSFVAVFCSWNLIFNIYGYMAGSVRNVEGSLYSKMTESLLRNSIKEKVGQASGLESQLNSMTKEQLESILNNLVGGQTPQQAVQNENNRQAQTQNNQQQTQNAQPQQQQTVSA